MYDFLRCRRLVSTFVLSILQCAAAARAQDDPKDWPTYNRDVLGTRHNPAEVALVPLVRAGSKQSGGFRPRIRANKSALFMPRPSSWADTSILAPRPTRRSISSRPTARSAGNIEIASGAAGWPASRLIWQQAKTPHFLSSADGIHGSALVAGDTVYFGDIGGWFYALDRATGKERWKLNSRAKGFPDAHALNGFFASPIMADGKVIIAGGTLEQVVASSPLYRGCTGRGFVMALSPAQGEILWKYDVGPKPQPLDPPITIEDDWGKHTFYFGPATSSVWCTPSFDAASGTIFFGTDVNTAPRRPTEDDPRLATREIRARSIALDVKDGREKWITQINPGDVWTNAMRSYDPHEGRYKDLSIGDTPKIYSIAAGGVETKVVGVGCKNGGFYVLRADDGHIVTHTPIFAGPPSYPLTPEPDRRMLALPSCIGGLQTGCATDGRTIFTNGIDALRLGSQARAVDSGVPPTGGRVAAISLDTKTEHWRHERPKVASLGGPPPKPLYTNVGDPVASGIAIAGNVALFTTVASGKLVALDAATGKLMKEIDLGPVWSGPAVSRGRVYVGTGNTLFTPADYEVFFPKQNTGVLYSFGQPGEDEVSRLNADLE